MSAALERRGGDPAAPGSSSRWPKLLQGIKTRALKAMEADDVRRGDPIRLTVESMIEVPLAYGEAMADLAAEMKGSTETVASRIEASAGQVQRTATELGRTIPQALDASLEKRLPGAVLAAARKIEQQREQNVRRLSFGLVCLGVASLLGVGAGAGWYAHVALSTLSAAAQVERLAEVASQSASQIEALTERADAATDSAIAALSPARRRDALTFANIGTADQRKTLLAIAAAMETLNNARLDNTENVPVGCMANGMTLVPNSEGAAYRTCLVPLPPNYPKLPDGALRQYYRR